MLWAICALVGIGAGLPLIAWVTTRGLARRSPTPFEPYHEHAERWIHQHYQLDWPECSLIKGAVSQGRRVNDPALEDATHRLAEATLHGKAPGVRTARRVAMLNVIVGTVMVVGGIVNLFLGAGLFVSVFYIPEGMLLISLGWYNYTRSLRKQKASAARALELNRSAASLSGLT